MGTVEWIIYTIGLALFLTLSLFCAVAFVVSFVKQELRPEKEQYAHVNDNLADHRERHHLSVNQNVKRKQKDHPNDIDPKL